MNFNFLQKQTSRREMLRYSATLTGSVLLAHLFPMRLLGASAARAWNDVPRLVRVVAGAGGTHAFARIRGIPFHVHMNE